MKPGEPGYDAEYRHHKWRYDNGFGGMPYATDDEVMQWDAEPSEQRKGQENG